MVNGEDARRRAQELARRTPLMLSTDETVRLAKRRLAEALERAREAHLSCARVHDQAAKAHDEAAARDVGDVEEHIRAAARHRAARDKAYHQAEHERELFRARRAQPPRSDPSEQTRPG